jgi:DNA-binding NarL/FixJ family response regulator
VLIVDDDRRVRQSLAGLISLREGSVVVGTTSDADQVLELVSGEHPDVVLVDVAPCEDEQGLALLRRLRDEWPALLLVAMSVRGDPAAATRVAGADAFISKTGQHEDIGEVLAGLLADPETPRP